MQSRALPDPFHPFQSAIQCLIPFLSVATGGRAESRPVLRYSKEQRPTTLPIQPFVFQHHFPKQLAKARALHSLSQLYSLSGCNRTQQPASLAAQAQAPISLGDSQGPTIREARKAGPEPETSRPSPLGSYSPIRSVGPFGHSTDSSASTSCSPPPEQGTVSESPPPWSHSCPVRPATTQLPQKEEQKILTLTEYRLHGPGSLPPLGAWRSTLSRAESLARAGSENSMASRPSNGMHIWLVDWVNDCVWGVNPGSSTCTTNTMPLSHIPAPCSTCLPPLSSTSTGEG